MKTLAQNRSMGADNSVTTELRCTKEGEKCLFYCIMVFCNKQNSPQQPH